MLKVIVNKIARAIWGQSKTDIEQSKVLMGNILANMNRGKDAKSLSEVEFKVFSQWGDDGIIQFIVDKLAIPVQNQTFVEFGVETYMESNTRFLLMKDNWTGLIIDGSEENINYVKNDNIFWRYNLTATRAFITKDNINQLIGDAGISGEIGILSVDIDGNDYYVWKAITVVNPLVVIVEYNSIWGYDKPYTIVYKDDFVRTNGHYSNLFYGTSLLSACDLAEEKGYDFIGCNKAGNNAYFIRKDKSDSFRKLTPEQGFVNAKFKESRNKEGVLNFLSGEKKYNELKGLTVFNTRTKKEEIL